MNYMSSDMVYNVFLFFVYLVFMKSVIIGSDFSFYCICKYGKKYWNWYSNRKTMDDFIKEMEKDENI